MRVVAAVCLLLVCSVVAPTAVLAETSGNHGQSAATVSELTHQRSDADVARSSTQSNESNESNGSTEPMGFQVSSFVQSTSAETSGVVENEMWEANVNRTGRSAAVSQRVERLDRRVSTLREERRELVRAYEDGNVSTLRYQAQLARLNGQLDALSAAAGSTERAATRLDVEAPGLSKLREEIDRSKRTIPPVGRPAENPGKGSGPPTDEAGNGVLTDENGSGPADERGQRGSDGAAVDAPGVDESAEDTTGNATANTTGNATATSTDALDENATGALRENTGGDVGANSSANTSDSGPVSSDDDTGVGSTGLSGVLVHL